MGYFLVVIIFKKCLNFLFFVLPSIITFVSDLIFGSLWSFWPKMAILGVKVMFKNSFWICSCS